MFKTADESVKQFCQEEGIKRTADVSRIRKALKQADVNWFVVWDALGVSDRDEEAEALYALAQVMWTAQTKRERPENG